MRIQQILTLVIASALSVAVMLTVVRYFAPQLLGVRTDQQIVRVAEEIPPFFEAVFRQEDLESRDFILQDPYLTRARPLFLDGGFWGPHDILGFRNRNVPVVADIVAIGDSLTYGMGAPYGETWPRRLQTSVRGNSTELYSMALGGWGASEYLRAFPLALEFRPRVAIVAFYTGNDPRETYSRVYRREHLADLRLDPALGPQDLEPTTYPPPESEWWQPTFRDGTSTTFTPRLRLASNSASPAIATAYAIMAEVGTRIAAMARQAGTSLAFTIVPTKELAFARRIETEGIEMPDHYAELVRLETEHIARLGRHLGTLDGAHYIDLIDPLQRAAESSAIYPQDNDGHPTGEGHRVIAEALQDRVSTLLPTPLEGAVRVVYPKDQKKDVYSKRALIRGSPEALYRFLLVRDGGLWRFSTSEVFAANGWDEAAIPSVEPRDIGGLPLLGTIRTIDVERFGPRNRSTHQTSEQLDIGSEVLP